MTYSIKQFRRDFPTDEACLDYIFRLRYPGATGYYKVRARKCYSHKTTRHQIHPLAGTIFHKSETPLTDWFFAIYLMAGAKNGVSAKELQRHLDCTYKTAWRIGHQIRSLMEQDANPLSGVVEADEAYIGGKRREAYGGKEKTPVLGLVKRGGGAKVKVVDKAHTGTILGHLGKNVAFGSTLYSDENQIYKKSKRMGLLHEAVNHSEKEFARGKVSTNTIEGFWSQMKRSIDGTYHAVSSKHLQSYVDEFAYRYSHRFSSKPLFLMLLDAVVGRPSSGGQRSVPLMVPVA